MSGLEAEGGDCPHFEGRGLYLELQDDGRDGRAVLRVYLKYGANKEAAIRDLERISRPGCRVYIGRDEIKRVQGGLASAS